MLLDLIKRHHRKAILTVPIIFLVLAHGGPPPAFSLYVRPTTYFPEVGTPFSADIDFHSTLAINATEGTLRFPADVLGIERIDTAQSALDVWNAQPEWANTTGAATWSGGIIAPKLANGSHDGNVIRAVFIAKRSVPATLSIGDAVLLAADGTGRDILRNSGVAKIYPRAKGMPTPDLDGDGEITARDIAAIAAHIGQAYEQRYDMNRDGRVNYKDVSIELDYYNTLK